MARDSHGLRRGALPAAIRRRRRTILRIAGEHGAERVRVFGSFARGDQKPGSDVDVLVKMRRGTTLLDVAGLKVALEDVLQRKVDVIADDAIKPALRSQILSEARRL